MTTFFVPKYQRSNFYGTVRTIDNQTMEEEIRLNVLNPIIVSRIYQIKRYENHIYAGEYLDHLSYIYYRTTTLDYIILMYNGFIHPMEIPVGSNLLIPNFSDVNNAFAEESRTKKSGTTII